MNGFITWNAGCHNPSSPHGPNTTTSQAYCTCIVSLTCHFVINSGHSMLTDVNYTLLINWYRWAMETNGISKSDTERKPYCKLWSDTNIMIRATANHWICDVRAMIYIRTHTHTYIYICKIPGLKATWVKCKLICPYSMQTHLVKEKLFVVFTLCKSLWNDTLDFFRCH